MNSESLLLDRSIFTSDGVGLSLPAACLPRHSSQPTVIRRIVRGFDPDQLRESFSPGEVEHRLLEPGTFEGHLLRINSTGVGLQLFRYSLPVALSGTWPEGLVTVIFGLEMAEGAVLQGQCFSNGLIAVLDRSTGIDVRMPARATCAVLAIDRHTFEETLLDCGAAAGRDIVIGVPLCVCEREARRLKGLLRAVLDSAELSGEALQTSGLSAAFIRDVLLAFARAVVTAKRAQAKGLGVLERRSRLVKKAEEYVVAHLDQSVRMGKLCGEVGASARALEYAFQGVYGMGAMRYLRTIRLNEVRKALLHAGAANSPTVTSTAMDWGFWHLGEFAGAYRRLFGEAPSETLRAASRKCIQEGERLANDPLTKRSPVQSIARQDTRLSLRRATDVQCVVGNVVNNREGVAEVAY
jgi:AraC family ethanolamine operon transcriptional activator